MITRNVLSAKCHGRQTSRSIISMLFCLLLIGTTNSAYALTGSVSGFAGPSTAGNYAPDSKKVGEESNVPLDVTAQSTNAFHFGVMSTGLYTYTLDGDTGDQYTVDLTYSEVPLPAAAWLFGSAILGFIGYSARRKV